MGTSFNFFYGISQLVLLRYQVIYIDAKLRDIAFLNTI